jgi:hypothetical protein
LLASELKLRFEHFATGNTFGSSLIDQRIDLYDVQNEQLAPAVQSKRRSFAQSVGRILIKVDGAQYLFVRERQWQIPSF